MYLIDWRIVETTYLCLCDLCVIFIGMLEIRSLMRFLDSSFILRLLYIILLLSLLPIADMYVLLQLAELMPKYLLLALVTATGILGLLFTFWVIRAVLDTMHGRIKDGYYPGIEFFEMAGLLVAAVLLITPGFVGDVLGLFLLLPGLRRTIGRVVAGSMEDRFKELYEYLKLYEL